MGETASIVWKKLAPIYAKSSLFDDLVQPGVNPERRMIKQKRFVYVLCSLRWCHRCRCSIHRLCIAHHIINSIQCCLPVIITRQRRYPYLTSNTLFQCPSVTSHRLRHCPSVISSILAIGRPHSLIVIRHSRTSVNLSSLSTSLCSNHLKVWRFYDVLIICCNGYFSSWWIWGSAYFPFSFFISGEAGTDGQLCPCLTVISGRYRKCQKGGRVQGSGSGPIASSR